MENRTGNDRSTSAQAEMTDVYGTGKKTPHAERAKANSRLDWTECENGVLTPGSSVLPLQHVKVELLSPGSCITNDSAVCDASSTMADGEVASVAMSADAFVAETHPTSSQVAIVCGSPVKSLEAEALVEQTANDQPSLTPASSIGSTVTAIAGALQSVRELLGIAKVDVMDLVDELVAALDMCPGAELCGEPEQHPQSDIQVEPARPANMVKPALDVGPVELHNIEVTEHTQVNVGCEAISLVLNVDCKAMSSVPNAGCEAMSLVSNAGCEEMSSVPTVKVMEVAAPVKSVMVHVKSEPVDSSREIGADCSVKELARMEIRNKVVRKAVKQEVVVNSTREYVNSVLAWRDEHLASLNDHLTSGSRNGGGGGGGMGSEVRVASQVRKRAGDVMRSGRPEKERSSGRAAADEETSQGEKSRNGIPGWRIQGGRIYDSSLGKTCHWCRQKTVEHHVKCRNCPINFCGACLMNRNGESIMAELAPGVRWLCPKCRNGCGSGCDNCCNCGPCRKAGGKPPTGQLIREARNAGFQNVHDYLVHLETDEGPEEIARRKVGKGWTNGGRFKWEDALEDSDYSDREDGSPSSEGEEFTLNEETSTQLHEGKLGMEVVKKFVQSQQRKLGAMRAAVPARSQVEATPPLDGGPEEKYLAYRSRLRSPGLSLKATEAASQRVEPRDCSPRPLQRLEPRDLVLKASQANSALTASQGNSALGASQGDSATGFGQGDSALGSRTFLLRTCKREYVEINAGSGVGGAEDRAVTKRRKVKGEEHRALSSEPGTSSKSSVLGSFAGVKCKVEPGTVSSSVVGVRNNSSEPRPGRKDKLTAATPEGQARPTKDCVSEGSELTLKTRGGSVLNGASQLTSEQRILECPSDPQGTEYRMKLKLALAQPFDAKELETSTEYVNCRKPLQKLRQMRGRVVDVVTEDEGFSYLDHYQDFAAKLEEAQSPSLKLALVRGFFFWLQHSCMEGAFRPWSGALTSSSGPTPLSGDCIETEGPDCQVTAVVLQLDEGKDAFQPGESDHEAHPHLKRKFTAVEQRQSLDGACRSSETKSGASTQTVIPFQVKKHPMEVAKLPKTKGRVAVQPRISYRIVQGLLAPALSEVYNNCRSCAASPSLVSSFAQRSAGARRVRS